ncbi:hypothetical protein LX32DRAFT_636887 [Colletotrichum zoysiae]|uniref:Uncharacterized protein n=1 Tax=Colletotrichum zoysiae TaxID=1216348 RepID=A0AAD9M2L8_9PEZI|nr:hypothetical protein LX32DRAFT_636887 [Colletotrichum zoysiae]
MCAAVRVGSRLLILPYGPPFQPPLLVPIPIALLVLASPSGFVLSPFPLFLSLSAALPAAGDLAGTHTPLPFMRYHAPKPPPSTS